MSETNQFLQEQLKISVKEYLELGNQLKTLSDACRGRRKRRRELSGYILELMKKNELTQMNIKGGKLIYATSKRLIPLSKKILISTLGRYFRDDNKAKELGNYIMKNRGRVEKVRLKQVKDKIPLA